MTEAGLRGTFTGTPDEIIERLRTLEAAGVDCLALQVVQGSARETIEEFGRQVIARM